MSKHALMLCLSILLATFVWWPLPSFGQRAGEATTSGSESQSPELRAQKSAIGQSDLLSLLKAGKTMMLVTAHPDDEAIAGPLLARAAETAKVIVVCFTKGEGGNNRTGPELDAALGEIRAKELAAAASVLGVEHRILGFWNGLPGGMRNPENARETPEQAIARWQRSGRDPKGELIKVIRQWRPDILITLDPEHGTTGHKEHRAVGMLATAAFTEAGDPTKFPEQLKDGLSVWQPQRLYYVANRSQGQAPPRVDELIDGNERSPKRGQTYVEIALEAVARHASQFGNTRQDGTSRLIERTALVLAATAKETTRVQPIESLWLIAGYLKPDTDVAALIKGLQPRQDAKVFDAVAVGLMPPTFTDPKAAIEQANRLNRALSGKLIVGTFPVGKDGWETSQNERWAQQLGFKFDASKAMSRQEWLETLKKVEADTMAWLLERPARRPTSEALAQAGLEFARLAKSQKKKVAFWLSAMMLREEDATEMARRFSQATRESADYFVWMDLPAVSQEPGQSLEKLLDVMLTLTPKEKTVIQWTHNPRLPTKDVAGTQAYISACQAKGINRFVVLFSLQGLEQEPWREFYRTLPKR